MNPERIRRSFVALLLDPAYARTAETQTNVNPGRIRRSFVALLLDPAYARTAET